MFSISNFFFLAIAIIFGLIGFHRGLVSSLFSLLGLVAGYFLALHFAPDFSHIFSALGVPGMLGAAFAGTGIFVLAFLVSLIPPHFINQALLEKSEDRTFPMSFRVGGALLGTLTGSFYAMMLVWLLMLMRAMGPLNVEPGVPSLSEKVTIFTFREISQHFILDREDRDRPVGALISQVISQPESGIKNVRRIIDNPQFMAAFVDPTFLRALQNGNETEVETHPAMQRLLNDADFINAAYELRMLDPEEEETRAQRRFAREFAFALTHAFSRIEAIRKNPEARAILEDPAIIKMLSEQDTLKLLTNAKFNRLLELIFNDFSVMQIDRERGRPLEWFLYASGPKGQEWTKILESNDLEENLQTMLKAAYARRFQYSGFDQTIEDSLASLENLAAKGHASAQFKLAIKFANGWDAPLNAARAVALLRESAGNHNDEALFHLAAMVDLGWGITKDPAKAFEMMQAIAGRGFPPALHCMALMEAVGREGGLPNLEAASGWFKKSSQTGSGQDYFFLGFLHLLGKGVEKNIKKSYQYFSLAKEKGFSFDQKFFDIVEKRMLQERFEKQRQQ